MTRVFLFCILLSLYSGVLTMLKNWSALTEPQEWMYAVSLSIDIRINPYTKWNMIRYRREEKKKKKRVEEENNNSGRKTFANNLSYV